MYPLNTHIKHRDFDKSIPIVEVKVSPPMNVVNDRLFLLLTCIDELITR